MEELLHGNCEYFDELTEFHIIAINNVEHAWYVIQEGDLSLECLRAHVELIHVTEEKCFPKMKVNKTIVKWYM